MQLLSDAIAVFGSRVGIAVNPGNGRSYLIRFSEHPGIPCLIEAGMTIGAVDYSFPLAPDLTLFPFMEQSSTFTSIGFTGVIPEYGIQVGLSIRIVFAPEDPDRSTIPALMISMSAERMRGDFRWTKQTDEACISGKLYFSIRPESGTVTRTDSDTVQLAYTVDVPYPSDSGDYAADNRPSYTREEPVNDLLCGISCSYTDDRFTREVHLHRGEADTAMSLVYAAYDRPMMTVAGELCPFWYTHEYGSAQQVIAHLKSSWDSLQKVSQDFDASCADHTLGRAFDHLSSCAFHSWLINTWFVIRADRSPWYTVWEGNCYFTSTVDVEYSQSPFYLLFWPELLRLQLLQWKEFLLVPDASGPLKGCFLSHDTGQFLTCSHQYYPHHMEIEENCNFILMAFAYWKQTGDLLICSQLEAAITGMMDYIISTDLKQTGIPATGCSNTIDDASPAIQYGDQQVYLGIKAYCAIWAGIQMVSNRNAEYDSFCSRGLRTITTAGWKQDHFIVNCSQSADDLTDPWTGQRLSGELEGWDAYHIFATNALVLLDMIGVSTEIPEAYLCEDLITSTRHTLSEYGCRHTSFESRAERALQKGLAGSSSMVGWLSMNMLRDAAALFRGIDLTHQLQNYWDWICTVNTREIHLFFETFSGNNLCFYPRGLAIFALYAADTARRTPLTQLR
ncbi:MAG: DUF4965 domain-containing protein [Spirochaetia bacterium]|nr:DUF4965 domain-containing protein [Spirochaetia bacterium]